MTRWTKVAFALGIAAAGLGAAFCGGTPPAPRAPTWLAATSSASAPVACNPETAIVGLEEYGDSTRVHLCRPAPFNCARVHSTDTSLAYDGDEFGREGVELDLNRREAFLAKKDAPFWVDLYKATCDQVCDHDPGELRLTYSDGGIVSSKPPSSGRCPIMTLTAGGWDPDDAGTQKTKVDDASSEGAEETDK